MKIKVCGMRDAQNIKLLSELQPDYMGFIFYPKSKRYAGEIRDLVLGDISDSVKKTGVFVNESLQKIMGNTIALNLQAIQLHGDEDPELCRAIKESGVEVIKAFGVDDMFDFSVLDEYSDSVDYFLFDTKTPGYGGSGKTFNWEILDQYKLSIPYFLSGGLNPENIEQLLEINDNRFYAADLNSGFEVSPGVKNIIELEKAINLLRI